MNPCYASLGKRQSRLSKTPTSTVLLSLPENGTHDNSETVCVVISTTPYIVAQIRENVKKFVAAPTPQKRKCSRRHFAVKWGDSNQRSATMHTEVILAYIDQNLKTGITADELAGMSGYSLWHFCRLFSQAVGMPVAAYISKRRLNKALLEISGRRKVADVASEYGFECVKKESTIFCKQFNLMAIQSVILISNRSATPIFV